MSAHKHKVQGLGEHSLADLILDGRKFDARLDGSTTMVGLERTIDAASTLTVTVDDPERVLQSGGYYERRADINLDDLWFRMARIDKTGDLFGLQFEDREVAIFRTKTKPRRMTRAKGATRALFLGHLVAEVPHVLYVCPELRRRQPVKAFTRQDQATLNRNRVRGIALGAKFKIKTADATQTQIRNLNRALNVAESIGAGHLATIAMICSGIGESGWMSIMNAAGSPYGGVLQGNVRGGVFKLGDVEGMAHSFLVGGKGYQAGGAIHLAKTSPHMDPGEIATRVEAGGAAPSFYGQWAHQAEGILKLYGGVDVGPSSDNGAGRAYVKRYEYSRGAPAGPHKEDTWACGQRLAGEVQWRWFIVAGVVYFISDYDLIRSFPRMTLNENTPGVDQIDYTIDKSSKVPNSVTVTARATRWEAPPGTVCVLDEQMGSVAGAWIVSNINRPDITDERTTITLTPVEEPEKEPASQVLVRTGTSLDGGLITGPATPDRGQAQVGTGYPLGKTGKLIGTPYVGTHAKAFNVAGGSDNWESENAVDLAIPVGTVVYAIDDGIIGPQIGSLVQGGRFAGLRLHLVTADNEWYYAHLSRIAGPTVRAGAHVKAGDVLGWSGEANGVAHLHLACKNGSPMKLIPGLERQDRPT